MGTPRSKTVFELHPAVQPHSAQHSDRPRWLVDEIGTSMAIECRHTRRTSRCSSCRNGHDFSERLRKNLHELSAKAAVLNNKVVGLDANGRSNFAR